MDPNNQKIEVLERALSRERAARLEAENILESKSLELFELTQKLKLANRNLEGKYVETNSALQGVFENLADAYVVVSLAGKVIEMNEAAKDLFGFDYTHRSLSASDVIFRDDFAKATMAMQTVITEGKVQNVLLRIYSKDKAYRTVHINGSLIKDIDGKAVAAQGIIRDITDQEETKQLLKEQKEQLEIIVSNSPLGIVLSKNGVISKTNESFASMLGYEEADLLKKTVVEISAPTEIDRSKTFMEELDSGKRDKLLVQKKYIKSDGSKLHAQINVGVVRDENQEVKYQVAIIEDIEERLKSEEQKQQLVHRLEESNKELEEYAHIVSHDLKSPLRSISALVAWVKEDNAETLTSSSVENLNQVDHILETMDELIDGILTYSSIGKELSPKAFHDLNTIVNNCFQIIPNPNGIQLSIGSRLPKVYGDAIRFGQLFQNLISNAVQHTTDSENGFVKVYRVEREDDYYHLVVEDNGCGIPEKFHQKVFDIFQSLSSHKESTGIGLSIVNKIVALHKGKVTLESKEGLGTKIHILMAKES